MGGREARKDNDGQVVLVTGTSSGFGRRTAETAARRGHTVFATMRDPTGRDADRAETLQSAAASESGRLAIVALDVTRDASVDAAVGEVRERAGRIDAVVNNAGQMLFGIAETMTADQLLAQLDVNLVGAFRVVRAVLPGMRERGRGLIVNVSSIVGRFTTPFYAAYAASKWGLEALSESLAYEVAGRGIDVALVEPGPSLTDLMEKRPRPDDEERAAGYPELARARDAMQARFEALLSDPDAPVGPERVADAIVGLIEAPPGARPIRTVVGLDLGTVRELNRATEVYRRRALEAVGLGAFADPSRRVAEAVASPEP